MANLPDDLRRALDAELSHVSTTDLTSSVSRLIERYRAGGDAAEPILGSGTDVLAYAAYRMPATFAAVRSAFRQFAETDTSFAPRTQVDIGGGTGAALWAAVATWPSLETAVVLEQVPEVIALGKRLAASAASPVVRQADWQRARIGDGLSLPPADLVTVSYVLGELKPTQRDDLVRQLASCGAVVALIEPGTPAGYERIVTARDHFIARGMTIAAPCPHDRECPIPRGRDWCHFSARVNRSTVHRQTKAATLGYEDEKFSYVIASPVARPRAANRVLRHPAMRKGLVSLRLCTGHNGLEDTVISKRAGDLYRAARDVEWGDSWPPSGGGSAKPAAN